MQKPRAPKPACCPNSMHSRKYLLDRKIARCPYAAPLPENGLQTDSIAAPGSGSHLPNHHRPLDRAAPPDKISAPQQTHALPHPPRNKDGIRACKPGADAAACAGDTETATNPQCLERSELLARTLASRRPNNRTAPQCGRFCLKRAAQWLISADGRGILRFDN